MNNNALSRAFTRREKVLLLLLAAVALVGIYFYAVHYPVSQRLQAIADEEAEVADAMVIAQAKSDVYQSMKSELEEIFALPQDEITVMPEYDNIQTLMLCFNSIFADTDPELSFNPVREEDGIAIRTVRFTFTAPDYARAKDILAQLTGTGYRCLLDSVAFQPTDGDVENNALTVSGSITFYEQAG